MRPSSLIVVAIKIFICRIKLHRKNKYFKTGLNNLISLDKLFMLDGM